MVKKYLQKNRDKAAYLLYGGCTTAVNLVIFRLLLAAGVAVTAANAAAIVCAVLFAYVTNTLWVFHGKICWRTLRRFAAARGVSAVAELVSVWMLNLVLPAMAAKLLTQIEIVVLNYVFSKKFVYAAGTLVREENKKEKKM